MGGVVFQFFGMLSVHVFRLCRCMHAKFTKAADFDAALAYFRSVVQKDTTELLGASVSLTAVVPTAAIVDPNGKGEADDVMNEDTVAPADAVVEYQCPTESWEPVTPIRHRVQKISAFVNVGDDGLPRFRCLVYNTSQLNKGMHIFLARTCVGLGPARVPGSSGAQSSATLDEQLTAVASTTGSTPISRIAGSRAVSHVGNTVTAIRFVAPRVLRTCCISSHFRLARKGRPWKGAVFRQYATAAANASVSVVLGIIQEICDCR